LAALINTLKLFTSSNKRFTTPTIRSRPEHIAQAKQ
jgi:hypothetical protein